MTALMMASRSGDAGMAKLLLSWKADPKLTDKSGKGALDYAKASGSKETIALIEAALK
jgi:ankyrin repeat protein